MWKQILLSGSDVFFWLASVLFTLLMNAVLRLFKAARTRDIIRTALHEIADAVREVAKVYVEDLKAASEDGSLTAEERKVAREMAIKKARENLGPVGLARLGRVLGANGVSLDAWMGNKVESAVQAAL